MIIKAAVEAAPGLAGLVVVMVFAWLILRRVGGRVADTFERQATAAGQQAEAVANLTRTIQRGYEREDNEHREQLILLKVLGERLKRIEGVPDEQRR